MRTEVSQRARRAITPATLLLALEQVARERPTLCSLLADAQFVAPDKSRR